MAKLPDKFEETMDGTVVFDLPFPVVLDAEALASLKKMGPLRVRQTYSIDYLHSYGQDSPFFAGLTARVQLGSRDPVTGYTYATPRGHDMTTGAETDWVVLPGTGTIHAFTVCYFGSEAFLDQTPFVLILVEYKGVDTLFLARLMGVDPAQPGLDWIGMPVQAVYRRNSKLDPTDIYFVPITEG
ncbi:MAG: hypothetical protein Kow00124_08480 [Anaerolineae bacterium]